MKRTCSKCGKDDKTSIIKHYLLHSHREEKLLCKSCFKESIKSERRQSLPWKISALFLSFIIIFILILAKMDMLLVTSYFSIDATANVIADFIWIFILLLIVVGIQGTRSIREVEAGIVSGLLYGIIFDLLLVTSYGFYKNVIPIHGDVIVGFVITALIFGSLNGVLFGLVYANLYNFLPGKTNINKSIFLGVGFWLFFLILGSHMYFNTKVIDLGYYLLYFVIIGFIGYLFLGYIFGYYWTKYAKNSYVNRK